MSGDGNARRDNPALLPLRAPLAGKQAARLQIRNYAVVSLFCCQAARFANLRGLWRSVGVLSTAMICQAD